MGASGRDYVVPYQPDLCFGTPRPTHADWDRFRRNPVAQEYLAGRWTGRAMILWSGDTPSEIAFWDYSGD